MTIDITVREFIERTSSSTATPGGGATAALAGALGAALASMSSRYTLGRKRFEDREESVGALLSDFEEARVTLTALVDRDVEAYVRFCRSRELPRGTPKELERRSTAMRSAQIEATHVPLECARVCRNLLRTIEGLLPLVNPNLVSDVGVAVVLAEAGYLAARLNVKVNLIGLGDVALKQRADRELREMDDEVRISSEETLKAVDNHLGKED